MESGKISDLICKQELDFEEYTLLYNHSINNNETFWKTCAQKFLTWDKEFTSVKEGSFEEGAIRWFSDGELNACHNAVDRHAKACPDKAALIYEADLPNTGRTITYGELLAEVCRTANWMKSLGYVKRGSIVTIYMGNIPESIITMLACARIGAIHNVVFAGFSSCALRERIVNCRSELIMTSDHGIRGGKMIHLKDIVDSAIEGLEFVKKVVVYRRTGDKVGWNPEINVWWHDCIPQESTDCPCPGLPSETELFILYTSGSTGKPKGLVHTTGGYLLYTAITSKFVFGFKEGDVFGCMADIGWITGHSYVVYGPLLNGITTVLFESVQTYPTPTRYWDVIEKHNITQLYTSPTSIRILKSRGNAYLEQYNLDTLRVIGTVGEPNHSETWRWIHKYIGKERCVVVDTYWQTESGGILITPQPGIPTKPGSTSFPFFGIKPVIVSSNNIGNDSCSGISIHSADIKDEGEPSNVVQKGTLLISMEWPGIARTILGDHGKYVNTYLSPYKGCFFTGDGAYKDKDGFYNLTGRIDDVINTSGHRLGTGEIENIVSKHPVCKEAAVLAKSDDLLGQIICLFVSVNEDDLQNLDISEFKKELYLMVRSGIGPIAMVKNIMVCSDLPRTASGKIIRRILRVVVNNVGQSRDEIRDKLGDLSTLLNAEVVDHIIDLAKSEMN